MKKRTGKLLSLLLVLALLLGMVPMVAFAEELTPITGVSLRGLSVPVVGEYVEYVDGTDLTENPSGSNKYEVIDNQTCTWKDEEGRPINYGAQVFEAGRTYSISFNVKPKDGYAFTSEDIPVELFDLYSHQYTGSIALYPESTVAEVTFTFTLSGERTYDDIVNFRFYEMRAPQDGDSVNIVNGVWAYNNSEMTDRYWTDSKGTRLENGTRFVSGNGYYYNYKFTAFKGYKFADELFVRANNEVPTNWEYIFNNERTTVHIKIPYFIDTAETVSSIVVDGMFVPNQTKSTRDFDSNVYLRVDSNANYTIPLQTMGWYEVDAEYSVDTQYEVTEPVFRAGKQYKMFLIIYAKDGYKFAPHESMSFQFSGMSGSLYTYSFLDAGTESNIQVVITFTAQFPDDVGETANNPAWCYSYIELKTALESDDIRYVAVGNVDDMLPLVSMEETGPYADNRWPGIWVDSTKNLTLLGNAQFTAPNAEENVHRVYDHLIQVRRGGNLAISGSGGLTFHGNAVGWTTSVVEVVDDGVLTVNSGTVKGDTGNRTSFCYGVNVNGGTLYVNDGTVIGTNRHDQAPISAVDLYDGKAYIYGGTFYSVVSDGAAGSEHYGLSIGEDGSCYLSGGIFAGVYMPYASTMDDYVDTGCTVTVNGVKTDPASCGTTDGVVEVFREVSKVNIHVNSPVAGKSPAMYPEDIYMVPEGVTANAPVWYENGQLWNLSTGSERFEAGSTYKVEITLVADTGVKFADPLTSATINSKTAVVSAFGGNAETGITLTVDLGACSNVVSEVELVIDRPTKGSTPDQYVTVMGSGYQQALNGVRWQKSSDGITWSNMGKNETFSVGTHYRVFIDLKAATGYVFAADSNWEPAVSATVNGKSAEVFRYPEENPDELIFIRYNFGILNDIYINEIRVNDIVEPVVGQKPSYTCSIGGNGYTINTAYSGGTTIDGVFWYNVTDDYAMNPKYHTFELGCEYKVVVDVKTEDGFEFLTEKVGSTYYPAGSGYINGNEADLYTPYDGRFEQNVQYIFTCKLPEVNTVILYDLEEPVAGETPDTSVTPAYPEYYTVESVRWLDEEDGEVNSFEQGRLYTVEITVAAAVKSGMPVCAFGDPVTAYIDGTEVTGWSNTVTVVDDYTVTLRYSFRKPAQAPIVQYYFFKDMPEGGEVVVGETLTVSWSTTWTPTKTEIQYWDGEMWDQWDVQYPQGGEDSYDFHSVDAKTVLFRLVAYVGDDPRAISNEFTITWRAPGTFQWSGDSCTVTVPALGSGVTAVAVGYRSGRMVTCAFVTGTSVTLEDCDTVRIFYYNEDFVPVYPEAKDSR